MRFNLTTIVLTVASFICSTAMGEDAYNVYTDSPKWVQEGLLSNWDNSREISQRQITEEWLLSTGNWPTTYRIFVENKTKGNMPVYATRRGAVSLLLSKGGYKVLEEFCKDCPVDLDTALRKHYDIRSANDLIRMTSIHIKGQHK